MEPKGTERRRSPRTKPQLRAGIYIEDGSSKRLELKLVDVGPGGIGIESPVALTIGSIVSLAGERIERGVRRKIQGNAHVLWCRPGPSGAYGAGLSFDDPHMHQAFQQGSLAAPNSDAAATDFYDVMELSQKANPETIHRVYRILAKRYHPDNVETGDEDQFRRLLEAYRVLSDPELRAGYDAGWQANQHSSWKIFDQPQATRGVEAERRKRQGILSLLYTKRVAQPEQPTLSIRELEDLLGCPREHLEFSLWYLKESAFIARSDNARFNITAKGVEHAEAAFGPIGPTKPPALLEPPEQAQNSEHHHGRG